MLKGLRDRTLYGGHGGKCDYQSVCGGCRARAYAYFKDYLAPDSGCKSNQEFWEESPKEKLYLANF